MAESESLPGTLANIIEETTLKWIFVGGMRHASYSRRLHGSRTGCERFFRREGRGRQDHDELLPGHRARESPRIRSDTQPPSHRGSKADEADDGPDGSSKDCVLVGSAHIDRPRA